MSGHLQELPGHTVVRCSGVAEDGPCGREQAIESRDRGVGVRVTTAVPDDLVEWLSSFGWRSVGTRWLCPFCAVQGGRS